MTSVCNKSPETPSPISVTIPDPSDPITNGKSISFLLFIINKSLWFNPAAFNFTFTSPALGFVSDENLYSNPSTPFLY